MTMHWYRVVTNSVISSAILLFTLNLMPIYAQYDPPEDVTLTMYRLSELDGGRTDQLCVKSNEAIARSYGCTAKTNDPEYEYPFESSAVTLTIESDIRTITVTDTQGVVSNKVVQLGYLHNILPVETPPENIHPLAVAAQAIVARTYAYWKIDFYNEKKVDPINNSASSAQVYLPFAYEALDQAERQVINNAIADRYYISSADAPYTADITINNTRYLFDRALDDPIFAEFNSESVGVTIDHPSNPTSYPYMRGVDEPISTHPTLDENYHKHGFIQNGASRWAKGNQGANLLLDREPWSVQWVEQSQILTHYYTSIHLRNANASNAILTPDARWVPLKVRWGTSTGNPPGTMCAGGAESLEVWVQNSGTTTWPSGGAVVFGSDDLPGQQAQASAANGSAYPLQPVAPGATYTATLLYQAPTGVTDGHIAGPRFEMYQGSTKFSQLQPGLSWPDYSVQITIRACDKQVYLPLISGGVAVGQ